MVVDFIAQNFTIDPGSSAGAALVAAFESGDFTEFLGVSAFASVAGVRGLLAAVGGATPALATVRVVVGVDQKATSQEALQELLKLEALGGQAYVFYQAGPAIFHPKFYLFEGPKKALLLLGSANLTAGGLFQNTEATLAISLDLTKRADRHWLATFRQQLDALYRPAEGPNLAALSAAVIAELVAADVVPTAASRNQLLAETRPRVGIPPPTRFAKRPAAPVPANFKKAPVRSAKGKPKTVAAVVAAPALVGVVSTGTAGELVWEKRNLPASDVQAPQPGKTNPTGGLRLVQAKFKVAGAVIDQTTYFRHTVFGAAAWGTDPAYSKSEIATAAFRVTLARVEMGTFELVVRHKSSGEARQGNYTTLLSWGATLGPVLRKSSLTGLTLRLFRLAEEASGAAFLLTIS